MAKIILGVSSSISIYKSLEVVSQLKKEGHEIFCVLTKNAAKMISPELFHNLSGNKVYQDMFDPQNPNTMEHIRLAKDADLMLISPATANVISKCALGIGDDLLMTTLLCLDKDCPVLIYPAMNPNMWEHPATQSNVKILQKRNVHIKWPLHGEVACGDIGLGKLEKVDQIVVDAKEVLNKKKSQKLNPKNKSLEDINSSTEDRSELKNIKIVLTSGGTVESIDPVRVLSNRSSGKMGFAIANELIRKGAEVTYLYGQISTGLPEAHRLIHFSSTSDLKNKLDEIVPNCDVLIMAAAPSDFKVKNESTQKIKKASSLKLELVPNPDILASLAKNKNQLFIGFAAESEKLVENGKKKLKSKQCEVVVANSVSSLDQDNGVGIGKDSTSIIIIDKQGIVKESGKVDKKTAAQIIVEDLISRIKNKDANALQKDPHSKHLI